jgi:hypothetical protein
MFSKFLIKVRLGIFPTKSSDTKFCLENKIFSLKGEKNNGNKNYEIF